MAAVRIPPETLKAFCEKHRVRELSFFGSVLRDDFGPHSDVDVLVEFEDDHRATLFQLTRMHDELSAIVGRPVDVVTKGSLRKNFAERIMATREVQYVKP